MLALVEAALDALANDAEAGERRAREKRRKRGGGGEEEDAELDEILGGGRESDGGENDDDFSGELFNDEVAVRAFASLKDAVEQGLDYLEGRAPGLVESFSSHRDPSSSSSSVSPPHLPPSERAARSLAPAAARCLGRLLADAPAAFGARPRALLPSLLRLECGGGEGGSVSGTCGRFFLPVLSGALAAEEDEDEDGEETHERMASLSLDDGDAGAWLSAARSSEALCGLAATLAAACLDAASAAAAAGGGAGNNRNDGDGEVAAAAAVLTGLLPRPSPSYFPLRPVLVPALASWAASRLGGSRKSESVRGGGGQRRQKSASDGAAASLLSTANEVARALALLLASSAPHPASQDLPDSAAAASSAALVACLRPGWAAWTLQSKKQKKKRKDENGESLSMLEGEEKEGEQQHRNEFGLFAAPMEDASHLTAASDNDVDSSMLVEKLKREVEGEGEESVFFDADGHDERGWSRALRAAAALLVAEGADSSSCSARDALVAAASSAPWLRELLLEDGEQLAPGSKAGAALRAFVGALRRRLSQ